MRWTPGNESADIEDRRGSSGGFGFGGAPLGIGGVIVLLVLSLLFKRNFFALFDSSQQPTTTRAVAESPQEKQEVQFVSFVLDDAQNTWAQILGPQYRHAKLVLFRDAIQSACGLAQTASGPFYCPSDEKIYLDLGFLNELQDRFRAKGEFAQAYVLAHENGHHLQTLLGIEPKVRQAQHADPSRGPAADARPCTPAVAAVRAAGADRSHHLRHGGGDGDHGGRRK